MSEINDKSEAFSIIVSVSIVVISIIPWTPWNKDKVKSEKIYSLVHVTNFEIFEINTCNLFTACIYLTNSEKSNQMPLLSFKFTNRKISDQHAHKY